MTLIKIKKLNSHQLFLFSISIFLIIFGFASIIGVELPSNSPTQYLTDPITGYKLINAPVSTELPFGTDAMGYDIFSQFYYGLKTNILFSLIASVTFILFGSYLGIRIGYYKRDEKDFERYIEQSNNKQNQIFTLARIRRYFVYYSNKFELPDYLLKALNSLPILLLILIMAILFQNSTLIGSKNVQMSIMMMIFGLISAPKLANMIVGKIKGLRAEEFIQASIVLGIPDKIIIFKHILWLECRFILLYQFAYLMGQASILEITLKYFNYGVFPPWISWGTIIINIFNGPLHLNMILPILFVTLTIYFYMGTAEELKKYGEGKEL